MEKWNKYRGFLIVASIFFICFALWKPNIIFANIATVFCTIALYLIIPSNKNEVLIKLSKNSFGIYLFHSPMIYITFKFFSDCNPVWVVGLNFVVWGGLSFILSNWIRKTRFRWIIGE
jgi:peptidoglycan/LPS O-acetylase OafA/YrhL